MKNKIIIVILTVLLTFSFLTSAFYRDFLNEAIKESEVRSAFEIELSKTKLIVLDKEPWSDKSDLLVWATIADKGEITFWYNKDHSPSIMSIGKYNTDFECSDTNNNLVYTSSIDLGKNNRFKEKFPFEVNNLQDMVDHYDQIVDIFDNLPHRPETALRYSDVYNSPHLFDYPNRNVPVECKLLLSI